MRITKIKIIKLLSVCAMIALLCLSAACGSENDPKKAGSAATDASKPETGDISSRSELDTDEMAEAIRPTATLVVEAGGKVFYADLEDNSSAKAFRDKISSQALEVEMNDHDGFEKAASLPWELPANDEELTTKPGDVILCEGGKIAICYDVNTGSFTRLAKIDYVTKEKLQEALGDGDVTVSFHLEWSE